MERAHLSRAEGHVPAPEKRRGLLKGELLLQGAGGLIAVAAGLLDHVQNGRLAGGDGGGPLADKDALRADTLAVEVVGPSRPPLDPDADHRLSLHGLTAAVQEHRQIRAHGVPDGVGDPEHGAVCVVHAAHRAVVLNAHIEGAAVAVGEGDGGILDVVHILPLQLGRFVFREHDEPPTSDLII